MRVLSVNDLPGCTLDRNPAVTNVTAPSPIAIPVPFSGAYNPATMGNQQWFGAVVSFVCPDCEISSLEKVAVKTGQPDREAIEYALGQRRLACHICKQAPNPNVLLHFDVHPSTEEDLKNRGFRFRDSQD
jgi:hypothetical protein